MARDESLSIDGIAGPARPVGERPARALTLAGLLIFAAVVPLLPPHDMKADATLVALFVLAVGAYARGRARAGFGRTPVDLPALVFLAVAGLATVFSVNPFLSLVPSLRSGEGYLVYIGYIAAVLTASRLTRSELGVIVVAVLVSGAVVGAVATAQFFGVDPTAWLGFRVVPQAAYYGLDQFAETAGPVFGSRSNATLGNPIFLGGYAALLLPLALGQALRARGWRVWPYGAVGLLLLGALIGSQTRAAWGAAALAVIALMVLLPRSPQTWRRLAVIIALGTLLVTVMVASRQAEFAKRTGTTFTRADSSVQFRLFVWKHTLPMIRQRPLLGWGFSTMLGRFAGLRDPEYFRLFGFVVFGIDTPHNDVLYIAYSIGLLGLGAYLWIWLVFGRSLWRGRAGGNETRALAASLAAALGGYLVWVQTAWLQVGTAHLFWTFGAMAVALAREAVGQSAALTVKYTGSDTPVASGA